MKESEGFSGGTAQIMNSTPFVGDNETNFAQNNQTSVFFWILMFTRISQIQQDIQWKFQNRRNEESINT